MKLRFSVKPFLVVVTHAKTENASTFSCRKRERLFKRGFPQMAKRKMGIPFSVVEGGHMFPLEHPIDTVNYIKELIHRNSR